MECHRNLANERAQKGKRRVQRGVDWSESAIGEPIYTITRREQSRLAKPPAERVPYSNEQGGKAKVRSKTGE